MGEQATQCELYAIPENGGQPVKINGIATLSEIQFGDNSYENEQFIWCDMMSEASFSIEMTNDSSRILNRFARRVRRYLRRHEQQTKRKTAKRRKCNDNKV